MADDSSEGGAPVARPASLFRRITAIVTMVILIGLLIFLVWRVYLHHAYGTPSNEPSVVSMEKGVSGVGPATPRRLQPKPVTRRPI